ncbi:MAG: pyridoxal phosphate-dependent aminotransferase [Leptospira sp.]|nr:pyridoxal phosphate-dependent aminotransferase [Leptospira sp.]
MSDFHFSKRFQDIELGEEENELSKIKNEKLEKNITVLNLIETNPTLTGLEFPNHIYSHNFNHPSITKYEPNPKGLITARSSISEYYAHLKIKIDSESLILTSSTSEAFSYVLKLLTNPDDEILIPSPGYPLFSYLALFENVRTIEYPLVETVEGSWEYSLEKIKSLVSTKTKLIIIVSPSNPTGSMISQDEWEKILEWSYQSNIPLLIDEVFSPYIYDSNEIHLAYPTSNTAPVFVLNGISKFLALPQMKLGWIHVQGKEKFVKEALSGLELISDTYLSVNTPIQIILPELLKWTSMIQGQIKKRIQRNLNYGKELFLQNKTIVWRNGKGGWYAWIELLEPKYDSSYSLAKSLLSNHDIFVHPGEWYGFSEKRNIILLSLIVSEDQFFAGLNVLMSLLK